MHDIDTGINIQWDWNGEFDPEVDNAYGFLHFAVATFRTFGMFRHYHQAALGDEDQTSASATVVSENGWGDGALLWAMSDYRDSSGAAWFWIDTARTAALKVHESLFGTVFTVYHRDKRIPKGLTGIPLQYHHARSFGKLC